MKRKIYLFFALFGGILLTQLNLLAQDYNEILTLPNRVQGVSPYEALAEDVMNDNLIAVSSLLECIPPAQCSATDVNVQVFDPVGGVQFSYRFGQPGLAEMPYAVVVCDNFQDMIVVGQVDGPLGVTTLGFVARVEINSGNVLWYQTYDAFLPTLTRQRYQGIERITNAPSGQEEYFVYGIAQDIAAGALPKVHLLRIDGGGNLLFSQRIMDIPQFGNNGAFDPTDMNINARNNYVMVGSYADTSSSGQFDSDIFLMEFDVWGQLVTSSLEVYDVNNGSGNPIRNERPQIVPNNLSGEYLLAFDSYEILNNTPGSWDVTGLRLQQVWNTPMAPPLVYRNTGFEFNHVSGAGLDPLTGEMIVGINHWTNAGSGSGQIGIMKLNSSVMTINSAVQYTPPVIKNEGYTSIIGGRGVYHKATHQNSDTYEVVRSDYNGFGPNFNCYVNANPNLQPETVVRRKIKLMWDNEPFVQAPSTQSVQVNGFIAFCDGTNGSFKKPGSGSVEAELLVGELKVYPNMIDALTPVTLEFEAAEAGDRELTVTNLAGQVIYAASIRVELGENFVELEGSVFGSGMNLVTFRDPASGQLITKKVIQQ